MKVTNVADACILFEHDGVRLLTDPWIGTATYGFWLQYPPPQVTAEEIGPLDWISISHLHEDHCDFATLERLDPTARIVIMERRPNLLLDHLVSNGIDRERITLVPPRTRLELAPGLSIEPLEADPAHEYSRMVDAAQLVHGPEGTVYFANDCEPYEGADRYVADNYEVALAMLPFYGGSGYPACYTNLTPEEKQREVARIERAYFSSMERSLRIIQPKRVTPVASWHCFAGLLAPLNPVMAWPTSYDAIEQFVASLDIEGLHLELFSPGQGIDLETGERAGGDLHRFTPQDRQTFAAAALPGVRPRHELIPDSPAVRVDRLLGHAAASFMQKSRYWLPDGFRYAFSCGEALRHVFDPATGEVSSAPTDAPLAPPYLEVTLDRRHFAMLLIGALSWNIEDAAGLLRYERVPNEYHPEVYVALNFLKI